MTLAFEGLKDNYFSTSMRYTRGYAVLVTPFDKFVNFFRSTPVGAPAGHRTDVGMTMHRTERLATVNDPCSRRHQAVNYDSVSVRYDYDTVNCVDMALNEVVNTACGCVTDQLPIPPALQSRRRCSRLNFTRQASGSPLVANFSGLMSDRQCVESQLRRGDDLTAYGRLVSGCQKACLEEEVVAHASATLLPSVSTKWTQDVEKLLLRAWLRTASGRSFVPALLNVSSQRMLSGIAASDHVAQLNVFFSGSSFSLFQEDWQYPIESFLSEGGGVIGLWVGASMLTMMEFINLIGGLVGIAVGWRGRGPARDGGGGGGGGQVGAAEQTQTVGSDSELVEVREAGSKPAGY